MTNLSQSKYTETDKPTLAFSPVVSLDSPVNLTLYMTARVPGWNLRRHEEDMQIPQKQAYDLVAGLF